MESIVAYYDAEFRDRQYQEKRMEDAMENALQRHEFVPYLQPKYDAETCRICGAEALIRWIDSDGKIVTPGKFIPLAENNCFVRKLDKEIFKQVCDWQKKLLEQGITPVPISVNVSRQFGFHILMDDFGTGYSSLMMLHSVPVDVIKLDKSFIDDYADEKGSSIIQCVLNLASKLNLPVIAEGVETKEQYVYLKNSRCDMIQGFYFSKPVSTEEFLNFIRT